VPLAGTVNVNQNAEILVVSQVALSLRLLIVAGLFVRTLATFTRDGLRIPSDKVLLFTMKPQVELYSRSRFAHDCGVGRRIAVLPECGRHAIAEDGPLSSRAARQ